MIRKIPHPYEAIPDIRWTAIKRACQMGMPVNLAALYCDALEYLAENDTVYQVVEGTRKPLKDGLSEVTARLPRSEWRITGLLNRSFEIAQDKDGRLYKVTYQ